MLHLRTIGWRDREYGKWTDEERRRFVGSADAGARSDQAFGTYGGPRRGTRSGLIRPGAGVAILVSGALLALGHFPTGHPILAALHFRLPGLKTSSSPGVVQESGTINTPSTAQVGTTLTFHGPAPPGNGPVTVEGSYDGGQSWQTMSTVTSANGTYSSQITLSQQGLLDIRIVFSDGSHAVGSINVT
jgi:hypothetical protein